MGSTGTLYKNRNRYLHLPSGPATTVVADRPVTLVRVITNTGIASSTLTVYNNNSASGEVVALITTPANKQVLFYDILLENGMTIVKSNHAADLTLIYV